MSEISRLRAQLTPPPRSSQAPRTAEPSETVSWRDPEGQQQLAEINSLLKGHTSRWDEARILSLLRAADAERLNFLLQGVDRGQLLSDVDDHTAGPKNHTDLLKLIGKDRVADLIVETRALMVEALQRGRTGSGDERCLRDLFLATRGPALTQLKNLVDQGEDHHDMHHLLHHDLDSQEIRGQILAHIRAEAQPTEELKVLSDIDDTFYANWVDPRYPKQCVYPGVRQFYAELDGAREGDKTFLTARPDDRLGKVKTATRKSLKQRGVDLAVVVAGALTSLISNEAIAAKKLEGFQQYQAIFPEYRFMFVGDSGQGDALLGLKLRAADTPRLGGVFIHDVKATPPAERQRYREQGVIFFDTYAGAAVEAHLLGLMPVEGAARVARAAVGEFATIKFADEAQRQQRRLELESDLARLNALLPPAEQVHVPEQLPDLNTLTSPILEELPHNN